MLRRSKALPLPPWRLASLTTTPATPSKRCCVATHDPRNRRLGENSLGRRRRGSSLFVPCRRAVFLARQRVDLLSLFFRPSAARHRPSGHLFERRRDRGSDIES